MNNASRSRAFNKQSDAIEFSKTIPGSIVFSWEVQIGGIRKYQVSTVEQFWSWYPSCQRKKFYEVIPSHKKAKLYLDLEFYTAENLLKDGNEMSRRLIEKINNFLHNHFNMENDAEDVLILDSSTSVKFSQHLIFTKVHFENNLIIKTFLSFLMSQLSDQERAVFQVWRRGQQVSFIDVSVYSKQRNFRIYLSEKMGKSTPLRTADSDLLSVRKFGQMNEDDRQFSIFKSSLVTNIQMGSQEVKIPRSWSHHKHEFSAVDQSQGKKSNVREFQSTKSPFPDVDAFILRRIQPGGFIRLVKYYENQRNSFIFAIGGSWRYCENVKRHHTSNNIYFICNVHEMTLVQKCHSCVGYASVPVPIDITESSSWGDLFESW